MFDADALAGIVEQFGGLTREELLRACSETAFRRGEEFEDGAVESAIDRALERYALVEYEDRLVAGPSAFPALPDGAEDLPHILDVEPRSVDRDTVVATVRDRFAADVADAVADGDHDACTHLLDLSYDLESWGGIDVTAERERLDDVLE